MVHQLVSQHGTVLPIERIDQSQAVAAFWYNTFTRECHCFAAARRTYPSPIKSKEYCTK